MNDVPALEIEFARAGKRAGRAVVAEDADPDAAFAAVPAGFREIMSTSRRAAGAALLGAALAFAAPAAQEARAAGGSTPFHATAAHGDVEALPDAGADPNARAGYGVTPLHMAAAWTDDPEVIAVLVDAGADLEARTPEGETPLHLAAALNDDPAVVEALLDAGANPGARDAAGRFPFDYAAGNEALKGTAVYWRLHEARFR